MSKLSDIVKGRKARKTVPFPGIIAPVEGAPEVVVDLVVLAGDEEAEVLECARAYAKGKGVDAPKAGDPEYDLGLMVHTLEKACKDHDSPPEGPLAPFFASAEEILRHLDRERIVYLYTLQQVWQDELSPTSSKDLTEAKIWDIVLEATEEDDPLRFFVKLPPSTVARCFHFTARRLRSLLLLRSGSTSSSSATGESTTSPPEPS